MGGNSCPSEDRIDGKIVVVTGATSGIGKLTALELAKRGGHVILAVRNIENGGKVADEIHAITGAKAEVKMLDLSCLKSVREFADKLGEFSDFPKSNFLLIFRTKLLKNSLQKSTKLIFWLIMPESRFILTKKLKKTLNFISSLIILVNMIFSLFR